MTTIVTRADKGSPLTNTEMDTNLTNLNSYKVEQDISGNATITGNVYLTGSGKRITGDFSNATLANRVMFQTSTVGSMTSVAAMPNGGGLGSAFITLSTSDPANAVVGVQEAVAGGAEVRFNSTATGTASFAPMTFYTGGSERMRIDTSGNVGIGAAADYGVRLHVRGSTNRLQGDVCSLGFASNAAVNNWYVGANVSDTVNGGFVIGQGLTISGGTQRFAIDINGNVVATSSTGGLGYGTGAGGTVTQATSKSTAVTLNKPTGRITMNNAALAAGAEVFFTFNCSLLSSTDTPLFTVNYSGNYTVRVYSVGDGACGVAVKNISAGSLSEAVTLNFTILKGAIS